MYTYDQLHQYLLNSFLADIQTFKPGNVSLYADGHNMCAQDFIDSAKVCTPILLDKTMLFGERLKQAVIATDEAVGCNTNLGILLLLLPLISIAEKDSVNSELLPAQIIDFIEKIDGDEVKKVLQAIAIAKPGGLGKSSAYDARESYDKEEQLNLFSIMNHVNSKDRIAYQYVNGYIDVIQIGVPCIKHFISTWNNVENALTLCYMSFMTQFPDTHIVRKHGVDVAKRVQLQAQDWFQRLSAMREIKHAEILLADYDRELKQQMINPGTSADLTVSSYFLYQLLYGIKK